MSKHNHVPTAKLQEINERARQARINDPAAQAKVRGFYNALKTSVQAKAEEAVPAPAPEINHVAPVTRDARVGMAAVASASFNTEPSAIESAIEQPVESAEATATSSLPEPETPTTSSHEAELAELIAEQAEDAAEDNIPIETPRRNLDEELDQLDPFLARQDVLEELETTFDPATEFTPDTRGIVARQAEEAYQGSLAHGVDGKIQAVEHGDDEPDDGMPFGFHYTNKP